MFNLFEQPWTLVGVGFIALFCLWLFRVFAPDKWRWWLLGIPVLIAVLGFGLDWLVESDTEELAVEVRPPLGRKCDRCWLVVESVGNHTQHPTLCDRCVSAIS